MTNEKEKLGLRRVVAYIYAVSVKKRSKSSKSKITENIRKISRKTPEKILEAKLKCYLNKSCIYIYNFQN